jgi:hypothetical protein
VPIRNRLRARKFHTDTRELRARLLEGYAPVNCILARMQLRGLSTPARPLVHDDEDVGSVLQH